MVKNFNLPKVVDHYDEHIQKLIPGYSLVHLHIQAILDTTFQLRNHSQLKILIAGCGTGYELRYLIEQFPEAKFVAFDPSQQMIDKCQHYLKDHKVSEQIELICGDSSVLHDYQNHFDVALCILVTHFLDQNQKKTLLQHLYASLKGDGIYLSYDMMKFQNQTHIHELMYIVRRLGLTEKQTQQMNERLDDDFYLIGFDDYQQMLRNIGFSKSECFIKISNFYGIFAIK